MTTVAAVIDAMRHAVPPGQESLRSHELAELRRLTKRLVMASNNGIQELDRFLAVRNREIALPPDRVTSWLSGRTVLVTGGTGCIGAELIAQIGNHQPRRLVSISRGQTHGWPRFGNAEYITADVTNPEDLAAVFSQVRPDVVFHLAAQRDPGLAERYVRETVATNVFGTMNVIKMSERFRASDLVTASSGKAVRPYSSEVYTSSKRTAEWLLSRAAPSGRCRCAAVRFTHVADNSIIYRRLARWCHSGMIRLHDPDTMFYVQSARESAQLMLEAGLRSHAGRLHILARTDLGWPVSLLDLAVGMLEKTRSPSPIYLSGHDPGYEGSPFPGLYDPRTAGQVSPLLNGFEAPDVEQYSQPMIDVLPVRRTPCQDADDLLVALSASCAARADHQAVKAGLANLAFPIFDGVMSAARLDTLTNARRLAEPHLPNMSAEHRQMLAVITKHEKARKLTATTVGATRLTELPAQSWL